MLLELYKQSCPLFCDVFKELRVDSRKTLIFDTELSFISLFICKTNDRENNFRKHTVAKQVK